MPEKLKDTNMNYNQMLIYVDILTIKNKHFYSIKAVKKWKEMLQNKCKVLKNSNTSTQILQCPKGLKNTLQKINWQLTTQKRCLMLTHVT